MAANRPQGFTVFALPVAHQKRLRTATAIERGKQEIKRRARSARRFPNEASRLRLVTALVAEITATFPPSSSSRAPNKPSAAPAVTPAP